MSTSPVEISPKDFKTDQQVKWCAGCGDHSILTQMQKILATKRADRDNTVFVSGIGCSSRFPYYMDTFGIHGIHGRAPAVATGVKCANPDLDVWVITGDGDLLSIGGNHFMHTVRRNVGLKIILFNNRIYGLTKGQYSPTSEFGTRTKSSPYGSIDHPMHPISLALGAEITFVARTVDMDVKHLQYVLERASEHHGTAFVEVYQNCAVYNENAYAWATDRKARLDNIVYVEHGKPLIFGANQDRGLRLNADEIEVVDLADVSKDDLIIHDEKSPDPSMAFRLARLTHPQFPEPMGVLRAVEKPTYDELMMKQIAAARQKEGPPDLQAIFAAADTWTVKE